MGKRTSFIGFLAVIVLISLLAFACSKKKGEDIPPPPPDSAAASESNEPNSPPPQELPLSEGMETETDADANEPELTRAEPDSPAPSGFIMAIAYSDKPAALIGDELLYEGDTVGGIKVIKINESTVEFEKNGRIWTQQPGETPPAYWADPNS